MPATLVTAQTVCVGACRNRVFNGDEASRSSNVFAVCEPRNWTIVLEWVSGDNGDQSLRENEPYGKAGWEGAAVGPDAKAGPAIALERAEKLT